MRILYTFFIQLYYFSILAASLFNKKAHTWVAGRRNLFKKIEDSVPNPVQGKIIWFHCASLGEFEQGRPLIEKIRAGKNTVSIALTFFSPSGFEIRKNYEGADYIFYLPPDTPASTRKFLDLVKPSAVVFIKYEFWYNFLHEIKKRKIPLYLASGIFRPDHIFFRWYGGWFRKQLRAFTYFFVQDENSEKLLVNAGFTNVSVSGDTRFDRVSDIARAAKKFPLVEKFRDSAKLLVAGSTWEEDEKILAQSHRLAGAVNAGLKLVIAPHEINERHLASIEERFKNLSPVRYSGAKEEGTEARLLIIDNIGMLSSLYSYGDIAYVGGGFGEGIHNVLEAAVFGMPVIFGPNYRKFNEAGELIEQGGGFSINNKDELDDTLSLLLNDTLVLKMASIVSKNYVTSKGGATEKIMAVIKSHI